MKLRTTIICGVFLLALVAVFITFSSFREQRIRNIEYKTMTEVYETKYSIDAWVRPLAYFPEGIDYKKLWQHSASREIALVKSIDNKLVMDMETFSELEQKQFSKQKFDIRKVEVICVYKGRLKRGDVIEYIESSILKEDGTIYMMHNYFPLIKGNYYLFFFYNSSLYDAYEETYGPEAKVDLNYLRLNPRIDIALFSAVDLFDTELSDELSEILLESRRLDTFQNERKRES